MEEKKMNKKICNAILDFNDGHFVMCEKEEGHKGVHKGLNFAWLGEGTTMGTPKDRERGLNHFKKELKKRI